jgi:hypothetical protein
VMMPTKWGRKARPNLKIISWRSRTTEQPQIADRGDDGMPPYEDRVYEDAEF